MKVASSILGNSIVMVILAACATAIAQEIPSGAIMFTPAKGKWTPAPALPGLETARIYGSSTKPERYLFQSKFPPNFVIRPHSHPDERHYTVLSGTWYIGFGTTFDESKLIALPPGSFYIEPANVPHFVVTKGDGAVLQIGGTGPTRQLWVNPADDPSKK